ncbi:helix-turn-helix transcriptional regulator [Kribbella antibiotica]|uniref:Helix-turn-helix transcriptional regulator n=1 Tax=Kribbella antibiotica TaxID=190195 RepID=A0A4R4ZU97_9ACTN|nr:LuxR C-terminal-related transcriptional regulator [Kribbella antibiotica]TDD62693.1 helix-turn-helix transcriptional regulator [Kribbella antibiotica]
MDDATAWRNRFMMLMDRLPTPTGLCLGDGVLVDVNPAFAQLLGTTPMKLRARQINDLLQPNDAQEYDRVLGSLSNRRRRRGDLMVRWPTGAGTLTIQVLSDYGLTVLLLTLVRTPIESADVPDLTDRELAVLRLTAGGATSAQAAHQLGLTADGVNYHLNRLLDRFRVPNRVALIARAYTLGILDTTTWPPT